MAGRLDKDTVLGGRFRVEELIGAGGMGAVYAALDLQQGHRVAVKVLDSALARDEQFRERFLSESRLASRLTHPNIVPVHAQGEEAGRYYLAMPLVETDLRAMMDRERRLDPTRALNIVDQVAWALDVAHAQGLVHRDVKPGNVLLTPRRGPREPDHAYLADFGIAKLDTSAPGLTRTGAFIGTASYASPEQGRSERLDGRSDQYSLTCVLFEALVGEPPFAGASADEVLAAHRKAQRPRASERLTELPPALDGVLARGLAQRPEDRFASCRELVAAARAAAPPVEPPAAAPTVATAAETVVPPTAVAPRGAAETEVRPTAATAPVAPDRGRRRLVVAMAGAVGLIGVVVALALLVSGDEGDQASQPDTPAPAPAEERQDAEEAVRETVASFAQAEGEQAVCATLTADRAGVGCDEWRLAQPTELDVQRVDVAGDAAQVTAAQSEFDDPVRFDLRREEDRWLIDEIESFAWKDADEVKMATAAHAVASGDPGVCDMFTERAIAEGGGRTACEREFEGFEGVQRLDVMEADVLAEGARGRVEAEDEEGERGIFEFVREDGTWRIDNSSG